MLTVTIGLVVYGVWYVADRIQAASRPHKRLSYKWGQVFRY